MMRSVPNIIHNLPLDARKETNAQDPILVSNANVKILLEGIEK